MGNCLRGNPDDLEVSENSLHHQSSTNNQQQQQHRRHNNPQQQSEQQQQQEDSHDQHPCRHRSRQTVSASETASTAAAAAAAAGGGGGGGKNQPLRRERLRWTCEHRLTAGQLRAKREEFWDTAPAFEGRREIWDALRAAASALESGDHELAQAILYGAGVTLPRGLLTDSYDELGTRYQLPLYVLAAPANLATEPESEADCGEEGAEAAAEAETEAEEASAAPSADAVTLKLRLSTSLGGSAVPGGRVGGCGGDIRVQVSPTETVARAKRQLERHLVTTGGGGVAGQQRQRWYCYGRQLTDRMRIGECPIPRGFVVQVVLGGPTPQQQLPEQQQQQQQLTSGDS